MVAMMPRFVLPVLFALILFGCASDPSPTPTDRFVNNPHDGLWQNAENAPIRFVLEQTWGVEDGEPEEMLARIGRIEVDTDGNIYLLDGQAATLMSWDAEGNHRWTLSGKGEGPGEFRYAYSMVYDGNESLYVFNQSGMRIDRFSTDGVFQESIPTESLGFTSLGGIGMPAPDVLVASEATFGSFGLGIRILRSEAGVWAVADSFEIDQSEGREVPRGIASSPSVHLVNGWIVNGHVSRYQFEIRNQSGDVERTMTRELDGLVPPGIAEVGNSRMIANFSQLGSMLPVADAYYLVEASWPDREIDPDEQARIMLETRRQEQPWENLSTLDLFDAAFNLLYSLESPGRGHEAFGRILTTDDQGRIYAVTKADFPQIGRYRVEITPP